MWCGLARDYALDAQVLLGKLEALYQRAVEDHHFHAGVRAVEAQARIAGRIKVAAAATALSHAPAPALSPGLSREAAEGNDNL